MAAKYRVSGAWRSVSNSYVKVGGVWKKPRAVYMKKNAEWMLMEGEDSLVYYFWPIKTSDGQYEGSYSEKESVWGIISPRNHYGNICNEDKPNFVQAEDMCIRFAEVGAKYKVNFAYPPAHGFSDKKVYIWEDWEGGREYVLNNANLINTGIYTLQWTGSSFNIV